MNLGGIKVSSVEIERVCNGSTPWVSETAAIAIRPKHGGPSELVMVVHLTPAGVAARDTEPSSFHSQLQKALQMAIKTKLNPLFHISYVVLRLSSLLFLISRRDVMVVEALPRTASNKVMRRILRDNYVNARDQKPQQH